MASLVLSNLLATLKSTFRVDKGTFDVSGLSVARTFTLPDASFTLAGYISATQRVLARNSGGAGSAEEVTTSQLLDWLGSTRGSLLYRGASGWAILAPGTAGYVFQSNGAGADPTWEASTVAITRTAASTSTSGDTAVIAAQGSGNKIAVYAYALQAAGTVTAKFTDGAAGASVTLPWALQVREAGNGSNGGQPLWVGTANTALVLNLTATIATGYEISWAVTT